MKNTHKVELRKYTCPECHNRFYVDCDDEYPSVCPFCIIGLEGYNEKGHSSETVTIIEGNVAQDTLQRIYMNFNDDGSEKVNLTYAGLI